MAQQINISGYITIEDENYPYKMPTIVSNVEGKGSQIKTIIQNMDDVALALHRDYFEINKFISIEIGSPIKCLNDTAISVINGSHSSKTLQSVLTKYIDMYILCKNCRLPDTRYGFEGEFKYDLICQNCHQTSKLDDSHKLTKAICNYINH